MVPPVRIAIAGGGLGGLAAARALASAGLEPTVFEQEAEATAAGSALFIGGNAVRAMHELGLGAEFGAASQYQRDGELRTPEGRLLFRLRADLIINAFGHPNACVERTRLRRVLLDGTGRERVRWRARVIGFADAADGVQVRLADGSTESFDALVGAEGIGSAVREQLHGASRARYVGYSAWRGVCEALPEWPQDIGCEQWGRGRRTGFSFLGGGLWGWWATCLAPPGGQDPESGRAGTVADRFSGWWGPVEALIRATSDRRILRNDIFIRLPSREWGRGRVTLLGDAAHLMTPDLGQGACQAIIDGVVLARCLRGVKAADAPSGLRDYEALRIPQTALVARRSFRLGRSAHVSSRAGVALRNFILAAVPPAIQTARLRRVIARSMG